MPLTLDAWFADVDRFFGVSGTLAREVAYRGGSYYQSVLNARADNRSVAEPALRATVLGLRVCATPSTGP